MKSELVFRGINQFRPNDFTEVLMATNRGLNIFKYFFREIDMMPNNNNNNNNNVSLYNFSAEGKSMALHDLGDQWYLLDVENGNFMNSLQYYGEVITGYGYSADNKELVLKKLIDELNLQSDIDEMLEANVRLEESVIEEQVDRILKNDVTFGEDPRYVVLERPGYGSFFPYHGPEMPKLNPALVKSVIPYFISQTLDNYNNSHQKDCYLLSFIAHLSGCLPNLNIIHDKKVFSPNINLFISAPAASGKSAMDHASKLFRGIDILNEEAFQTELEEFTNEQKNSGEDKKSKPIKKLLFIPGNTSSSAIIKTMYNNGGYGILCKTEADTLTGVLSKDWANFDDLLRKAFQNECVSQLRTNSDNTFILNNPQLSVILTGTPEQICRLIPSTENGLFSRFLFYYFENGPAWRKVFNPDGWEDSRLIDKKTENFLMEMHKYNVGSEPIYFEWTTHQATLLDIKFKNWLHKYHEMFGPGAISVVYRLGLILSRITGTLAYLEHFHSKLLDTKNNKITATKDIFKLSEHIIDILIEHSLFIFQRLPKESKSRFNTKGIEGSRDKFWELLPEKFTRKDAIEKYAPEAKIKTRTADLYLSEYQKHNILEKGFSGEYNKIV